MLVALPSSIRRKIAAGVLCAATGCGGDDEAVGATPIPSVEEFVARSNEVYCSKLRDCCSADALAEHPLGGGSVEDCAALLEGPGAILQASIDAGRAEYDPHQGGSCVEAYAGLSCDDPRLHTSGSLSSCENVLRGMVAPGEYCDQPYECAEGSCALEIGGFCAPPKAIGEPCLTHRDCESNYCAYSGCSDAPPATESICD